MGDVVMDVIETRNRKGRGGEKKRIGRGKENLKDDDSNSGDVLHQHHTKTRRYHRSNEDSTGINTTCDQENVEEEEVVVVEEVLREEGQQDDICFDYSYFKRDSFPIRSATVTALGSSLYPDSKSVSIQVSSPSPPISSPFIHSPASSPKNINRFLSPSYALSHQQPSTTPTKPPPPSPPRNRHRPQSPPAVIARSTNTTPKQPPPPRPSVRRAHHQPQTNKTAPFHPKSQATTQKQQHHPAADHFASQQDEESDDDESPLLFSLNPSSNLPFSAEGGKDKKNECLLSSQEKELEELLRGCPTQEEKEEIERKQEEEERNNNNNNNNNSNSKLDKSDSTSSLRSSIWNNSFDYFDPTSNDIPLEADIDYLEFLLNQKTQPSSPTKSRPATPVLINEDPFACAAKTVFGEKEENHIQEYDWNSSVEDFEQEEEEKSSWESDSDSDSISGNILKAEDEEDLTLRFSSPENTENSKIEENNDLGAEVRHPKPTATISPATYPSYRKRSHTTTENTSSPSRSEVASWATYFNSSNSNDKITVLPGEGGDDHQQSQGNSEETDDARSSKKRLQPQRRFTYHFNSPLLSSPSMDFRNPNKENRHLAGMAIKTNHAHRDFRITTPNGYPSPSDNRFCSSDESDGTVSDGEMGDAEDTAARYGDAPSPQEKEFMATEALNGYSSHAREPSAASSFYSQESKRVSHYGQLGGGIFPAQPDLVSRFSESDDQSHGGDPFALSRSNSNAQKSFFSANTSERNSQEHHRSPSDASYATSTSSSATSAPSAAVHHARSISISASKSPVMRTPLNATKRDFSIDEVSFESESERRKEQGSPTPAAAPKQQNRLHRPQGLGRGQPYTKSPAPPKNMGVIPSPAPSAKSVAESEKDFTSPGMRKAIQEAKKKDVAGGVRSPLAARGGAINGAIIAKPKEEPPSPSPSPTLRQQPAVVDKRRTGRETPASGRDSPATSRQAMAPSPAPGIKTPKGVSDIFSWTDEVLASKYQFYKEIGFGNWGSVWKCRVKEQWEGIGNPVLKNGRGSPEAKDSKVKALKLVHRVQTSTSDGRPRSQSETARLKRTTEARIKSLWTEFKIIRSFKSDPHPNIVHFQDFIITPSYAIVVMDFHPQLMPVALPEHVAREYLRQLLDAVHYLHDHGISHNDIKPANILLSPENKPILVDFGFAQCYDLTSSNPKTLEKAFKSYLNWGTPEYLSPERARKELHDEIKADIWALGVTIYEIVVGRTPFEENGEEEFLTEEALVVYYDRTMMKDKRFWGKVDISKEFEHLIRRMVEPDPHFRIQTCKRCLSLPFFLSAEQKAIRDHTRKLSRSSMDTTRASVFDSPAGKNGARIAHGSPPVPSTSSPLLNEFAKHVATPTPSPSPSPTPNSPLQSIIPNAAPFRAPTADEAAPFTNLSAVLDKGPSVVSSEKPKSKDPPKNAASSPKKVNGKKKSGATKVDGGIKVYRDPDVPETPRTNSAKSPASARVLADISSTKTNRTMTPPPHHPSPSLKRRDENAKSVVKAASPSSLAARKDTNPAPFGKSAVLGHKKVNSGTVAAGKKPNGTVNRPGTPKTEGDKENVVKVKSAAQKKPAEDKEAVAVTESLLKQKSGVTSPFKTQAEARREQDLNDRRISSPMRFSPVGKESRTPSPVNGGSVLDKYMDDSEYSMPRRTSYDQTGREIAEIAREDSLVAKPKKLTKTPPKEKRSTRSIKDVVRGSFVRSPSRASTSRSRSTDQSRSQSRSTIRTESSVDSRSFFPEGDETIQISKSPEPMFTELPPNVVSKAQRVLGIDAKFDKIQAYTQQIQELVAETRNSMDREEAEDEMPASPTSSKSREHARRTGRERGVEEQSLKRVPTPGESMSILSRSQVKKLSREIDLQRQAERDETLRFSEHVYLAPTNGGLYRRPSSSRSSHSGASGGESTENITAKIRPSHAPSFIERSPLQDSATIPEVDQGHETSSSRQSSSIEEERSDLSRSSVSRQSFSSELSRPSFSGKRVKVKRDKSQGHKRIPTNLRTIPSIVLTTHEIPDDYYYEENADTSRDSSDSEKSIAMTTQILEDGRQLSHWSPDTPATSSAAWKLRRKAGTSDEPKRPKGTPSNGSNGVFDKFIQATPGVERFGKRLSRKDNRKDDDLTIQYDHEDFPNPTVNSQNPTSNSDSRASGSFDGRRASVTFERAESRASVSFDRAESRGSISWDRGASRCTSRSTSRANSRASSSAYNSRPESRASSVFSFTNSISKAMKYGSMRKKGGKSVQQAVMESQLASGDDIPPVPSPIPESLAYSYATKTPRPPQNSASRPDFRRASSRSSHRSLKASMINFLSPLEDERHVDSPPPRGDTPDESGVLANGGKKGGIKRIRKMVSRLVS